MIDIIILLERIGIFIFVWVTSFLLHEMMHIKSQGPNGNIDVWKYGMTCTVEKMTRPQLFYYAGGIFTSPIMFICALLSAGWWSWSFLTLGLVQLFYGIYEGYNHGNVSKRYYIYGSVVIVMLILWIILNGI